MKICHLTSGHRPDDDRIYYKEARSLAARFDSVWIVSPYPNAVPASEKLVHFKPFVRSGGLRGRWQTIGKLFEAGLRLQADVYHCHEPESLIAGLRIKKRTGCMVIFDSHEDWGASLAQRFPRPFWNPVWKTSQRLERTLLRKCDAAIGASWAISERLARTIDPDRVATILNVPVSEVFGEQAPRAWDNNTTILCHDGYLSFDRGLKTMARAVRLVSQKHRVVLKIVGDVYEDERTWLDAYVRNYSLENVIIRTGWLEYSAVGQALAPCHIGLIVLQKTPNNIVTSSNKVFNYMLYGIPFIGPDFRLSKIKLVQDEKCGILADSSSPEDYAEKICRMIEHREETLEMSRRALEASRTKYRWKHMEPVLYKLYEQVYAGKR